MNYYLLFTIPFILLWLTSRKAYQYSMTIFATIKLKALDQSLDQLYYSFEQVVYFYNQTTHVKAIKQMKRDDIHLRMALCGILRPDETQTLHQRPRTL